jgi:hypothetical protein
MFEAPSIEARIEARAEQFKTEIAILALDAMVETNRAFDRLARSHGQRRRFARERIYPKTQWRKA